MKRPIFVRPFSDAERETLEAGLRSSDAFSLRRCQILIACDRGENAYQIAHELGCNPQTARIAIHTFNHNGLPEALRHKAPNVRIPFIGLSPGSRTGRGLAGAFAPQTQRIFAKDTSLWTLDLAAEVSFEEGLTEGRITGETVRATLARMGIHWERAKRWITSPDLEYARKKLASLATD
jgi:Winged helix-turn helix